MYTGTAKPVHHPCPKRRAPSDRTRDYSTLDCNGALSIPSSDRRDLMWKTLTRAAALASVGCELSSASGFLCFLWRVLPVGAV